MDVLGGRRTVLELLRAKRPVRRIHLAKGLKPNRTVEEILELSSALRIPVDWVDRRTINIETGGAVNQGVAALVEPFEFMELSEALSELQKLDEALLIALDGITDPHNVGALIRTADAAGAFGIVLPKRRSAPVTGAVHKTSAGAVEHVPVIQVGNLVSALDALKEAGFWVYGADSQAKQALFDADFADKMVLVLGSEGSGVSRLVKEKCDVLLSVPMKGKISSLNVSVAGALFMYEVMRRRTTRNP